MNVGAGVVFGMFIGGIGACVVYTLMNVVHQGEPTPHVSGMTQRVQSLGRYGEIKIKTVRRRLPVRIPGASLGVTPPEDAPLHTNPLPRRTLLVRLRDVPFAVKIYARLNAFSIIESQSSFAAWWAEQAENERRLAYRSRHQHATMPIDWKIRWASYPTQWWPTLATSGDAAQVVRHIIPEVYFDVTSYDVPVR